MNTQTVLVEFRNTEPFFYTIKSKNPITIDSVARYFEITEGFNPDRDSITFLDESTTKVMLDRKSTRLNSSHVSESRMPSSA